MKGTTRRSDKTPKPYSNSFNADTCRNRARSISTLVFAGVLTMLLAPGALAQQGAARDRPASEVPSPVLTREAELSEAEAALGELSRRLTTVADAVEREGPAAYRVVLEELRRQLVTWATTISAMSVEPAEDADIRPRRFRRFERRMRGSTADVNAAVERINRDLRSVPESARAGSGGEEDGGEGAPPPAP
ncbi:MAG: hypothetical protein GVY23_07305 [Spirochaetes bacterium]|jgi:hypothetical protein|nr:hypothetical protein [Spirochaetota bacterium]